MSKHKILLEIYLCTIDELNDTGYLDINILGWNLAANVALLNLQRTLQESETEWLFI